MPTSQPWPPGIPPRRRRPRISLPSQDSSGAIVGGVLGVAIGAALGENTEDSIVKAAIGGLGGSIAGNALLSPKPHRVPLSLERSLSKYLSDHGADFVSIRRLGRYRVFLLYSVDDQFWTLESVADSSAEWTAADLDDWLYGDLTQAFDRKQGGNEAR